MKQVALVLAAALAVGGTLAAPDAQPRHSNTQQHVALVESTAFYPPPVKERHDDTQPVSRYEARVPIPKPSVQVSHPKTQAPHKKARAPRPADHQVAPATADLWPGATAAWNTVGGALRSVAVCIVGHESRNYDRQGRRLYTAENPYSTASGVMQAIDSTGRAWIRAIGAHWRGHMSLQTPYEQDRAFIYGLTHDRSAWKEC